MPRTAGLLLALALCGCSQVASPGGTGPDRVIDRDTGEQVGDQCDLPVEERTGGWFCHEPAPSSRR